MDFFRNRYLAALVVLVVSFCIWWAPMQIESVTQLMVHAENWTWGDDCAVSYSRGIDSGKYQVARGRSTGTGQRIAVEFQVSPKLPIENLQVTCEAQDPSFRFTAVELNYLGLISLHSWQLPSDFFGVSRSAAVRGGRWQLQNRQPVSSAYKSFPQNYVVKVFLIIALAALVFAWSRRAAIAPRPVNSCASNTWLNRLLPAALVALIFINFRIAAGSPENIHPDESQHFSATRYYMTHWLPIRIDDPQNAYLYDHYGMTRINSLGVEYFLAGKLALIIKACGGGDLFSCRFFNPFLLLVLCALSLFLWRENSALAPLFPVFFLTPQVSYTFSYMNDDAFPFFLSLVFLVLYFRNGNSHLVLKGAILGLLFISKVNFLVFVLFVAVLALTEILERNQGTGRFSLNKTQLRIWGVIFTIAALVVTARLALDVSLNGFDRAEKINAANEKYAALPFKLSTAEKNPGASIWLKAMRKKGVPATDLLSRYNWFPLTAASFVAVYGYYTIPSPGMFYVLMGIVLAAMAAYVVAAIILRRGSLLHLGIAVAFLLLIMSLAFYRSWDFEFQPQGRHLFPFLGVAAWLVFSARELLDRRIMNVFFSLLFAGSLYSLLSTALPGLVPSG